MSLALDKIQGLAKDFGYVSYGNREDTPRIVEIAMEDDDMLSLAFEYEQGKTLRVMLPAERLRSLLIATL